MRLSVKCDALGGASRAEQPSQIIIFSGSLKLVWHVRSHTEGGTRTASPENNVVNSSATISKTRATCRSYRGEKHHRFVGTRASHPCCICYKIGKLRYSVRHQGTIRMMLFL